MSLDYPRHVAGYPTTLFQTGIGTLLTGESATFNQMAGPGEVLGFSSLKYGGSLFAWFLQQVKITIDSVDVFNGYLTHLMGCDMRQAAHGLFGTVDLQSAALQCASFSMRMPYVSTSVIKFTNIDALSFDSGWCIYYRRGE